MLRIRTPPRFTVLFWLVWFCILPKLGKAQSKTVSEPHEVHIAMKNVMYHYTGPIAVHIVQLQGELVPNKVGSIVVFDDKNSFTIAMVSAEIAISCTALAQALNEDVFSAADAPIKAVTIESKNNRLVIRGKFHQKKDVPFETIGTVSANGDGRIRLHSEHVKAAHLPVKGIMDLLGLDLARLINTNKVQGIAVDKDDLIIDPQQILPAPRIRGKVTAVRIQGNDIVQVFGSERDPHRAPKQAGNFISLRDGEVRFGKLTMRDSDIVMVDLDEQDPFDFYIDHYQQQLIAGYTKTTPELGLRVYMRDFSKLNSRSPRVAAR